MNFSIQWHPQAFKNLEKLEKPIIERILRKMDAMSIEPFRCLERFEKESIYKFRICEYRALIEVDMEAHALLVQDFDHRSRIYKRI